MAVRIAQFQGPQKGRGPQPNRDMSELDEREPSPARKENYRYPKRQGAATCESCGQGWFSELVPYGQTALSYDVKEGHVESGEHD